jgi:hypothetical protein
MDPQLQRAYDALQQADAAGNKEDAQQIADYIRELQTQQQNKVMLEAGEESMMRNPMAAGAVGAVAGPVAGKVLETAYGPKGVPTVTPGAAPSMAGAPGQKYAAKTGYGAGTGETVREVVEEFKKQEGPLGKGKVTSKITGGPLGGPAAMEQIAAKEADAARFAQMRAANQMAAQKASSVPGRIAQATAGKMPLLLKSAAGAGAGMQGADAYNRFQEGDYLGSLLGGIGAAGSAASLIPHPVTRIGGTAVGMGAGALNAYIDYLKNKAQPQPQAAQPQPQPQAMATGGLVNLAKGKAVSDALKKLKFDKFKMSEVYPDVIPPVMATDAKTGKQFLQKQLSPEAIDVQKARKLAQKEIDVGNYEPFFDIEKRFYADPSRYQLAGTTLTDIVPKKADTIAKYEQLANQPESLLRLRSAFDAAKDRPLAKDWYAMGQLENEFIRELGPIEGPKQFRARFADAMAATTGGADPNSNLMMAAFTNYQKGLGKEIPTTAADLPFPIGGRFVSGNMEQAKKLQDLGLIPVTNPKRHNFSANFLGYRDRSTLDEQMSQLWDPKMMAPPPNAYGIYEQALAKEARRAGVEPANFQDIAWAGAKDYPGKPMIREINEMLARTNMITGEPQEDILRGYIRANKPMYGIAGAGAGVSLDEEEKASGGLVGYKEGGSTTPAWQRSEGKSPSGGLNALGRASYKRETGGELKAPQPEGGSRKKSFCARMGGMKKKLTSSKTANDPDSRINKALRKWKC